MRFSDEVLSYIYDKNDGYCWYCDKRLAFSNYGVLGERGAWEIDHSVPKSRGGTDYLRNLVPACIDCNRQKGTRMGKSLRASSSTSNRSQAGPSLGEIIVGGALVLGAAYLLASWANQKDSNRSTSGLDSGFLLFQRPH
jgi:hypothetical protein